MSKDFPEDFQKFAEETVALHFWVGARQLSPQQLDRAASLLASGLPLTGWYFTPEDGRTIVERADELRRARSVPDARVDGGEMPEPFDRCAECCKPLMFAEVAKGFRRCFDCVASWARSRPAAPQTREEEPMCSCGHALIFHPNGYCTVFGCECVASVPREEEPIRNAIRNAYKSGFIVGRAIQDATTSEQDATDAERWADDYMRHRASVPRPIETRDESACMKLVEALRIAAWDDGKHGRNFHRFLDDDGPTARAWKALLAALEGSRADGERMREVAEAADAYLRVKKTWDNRLPQLQRLRSALAALRISPAAEEKPNA
jgi:hypothetical protein